MPRPNRRSVSPSVLPKKSSTATMTSRTHPTFIASRWASGSISSLHTSLMLTYSVAPTVMKMHDTPYLFDLVHFSSITHSSRRSFPTLIQDQTILQTDKYIIQLRIVTILSRYGTGGNSPFPLRNPSTRATPLPHPPTSSRLDSRRCLPQIRCLQ